MEKGWEKVFESRDALAAEFIKSMLFENEIPAVMINKTDSSLGILIPGKAEVYVHEENISAAKKLIDENENNL